MVLPILDIPFVASKVLGALIRVDTLVLLLASGTVILGLFARRGGAASLSVLTLIVVSVSGFLPVGNFLIETLEFPYRRSPSLEGIDGLVVLGGAMSPVHDPRGWDLNEAGDRLAYTGSLARAFPNARIVVSGGSGDLWSQIAGNTKAEALGMRDYLTSEGVSPGRIRIEPNSRNTVENARFSLALVNPEPAERWALVTSAFHMRRALAAFSAAGWTNIIPAATDFRSVPIDLALSWDFTRGSELINLALKEYLGLLDPR